ncbi:MAG: MgtC/SapB family protein [Negativicutes bacterium]|jgi:putative Mg2+ transporter-C (MgtC) family protein
MIADWEVAFRLVASALFAGIIGYERQSRHKAAGLRTHILVAVGSCLIMVLSINIYSSVQGLTNADPARLAAQVVSGVGFLGAGSILKEGPTIKGLTTAASLWVVSGVGLAAGAGYYLGALMATVLVFLTLTILARMEHKDNQAYLAQLIVKTLDIPGQIGQISSILGNCGASIRDIKIEQQDTLAIITINLLMPSNMSMSDLTQQIIAVKGVKEVRQE